MQALYSREDNFIGQVDATIRREERGQDSRERLVFAVG